jgi:hypothetical protein
MWDPYVWVISRSPIRIISSSKNILSFYKYNVKCISLSHNPTPQKSLTQTPPYLISLAPDLDADLDAPIANLDAAPIIDLAATLLAVEELCCDYPRGGLAIVMVCGF